MGGVESGVKFLRRQTDAICAGAGKSVFVLEKAGFDHERAIALAHQPPRPLHSAYFTIRLTVERAR